MSGSRGRSRHRPRPPPAWCATAFDHVLRAVSMARCIACSSTGATTDGEESVRDGLRARPYALAMPSHVTHLEAAIDGTRLPHDRVQTVLERL